MRRNHWAKLHFVNNVEEVYRQTVLNTIKSLNDLHKYQVVRKWKESWRSLVHGLQLGRILNYHPYRDQCQHGRQYGCGDVGTDPLDLAAIP